MTRKLILPAEALGKRNVVKKVGIIGHEGVDGKIVVP